MNAVIEKTVSRDYCYASGEASFMKSAKLAALLYKHMWAVRRAHRRDSSLKNNVEYYYRDIWERIDHSTRLWMQFLRHSWLVTNNLKIIEAKGRSSFREIDNALQAKRGGTEAWHKATGRITDCIVPFPSFHLKRNFQLFKDVNGRPWACTVCKTSSEMCAMTTSCRICSNSTVLSG